MSDITMCVNSVCHARSYCYRQQAKSHPTRQSMADFTPKNNVFGEGFECENYYSMHENWFKEQDTKILPIKNQCDSCNAGHYKDVQGMHRDENSNPIMVCQAYKYK